MLPKYALLTGASRGIGRAIADMHMDFTTVKTEVSTIAATSE